MRHARLDPALAATIVSRRPLHYRASAHPSLDRPPHVRAGSSLTWVGNRLGLVQDDANFVALVDPRSGLSRSIALPAGEEGKRHFDDARGNKRFKLDLEACCTIEGPSGTLLLALGSGSKKRRRRVVTVESGDTIEKVASRMAVSDRPVERFMVLNGLEQGERLKPGDQVKIVVE